MRPRIHLATCLCAIFAGFLLISPRTVHSSEGLGEKLKQHFENEPALLKVHLPADKKGLNYYPFRKDKKIDYAGRGVGIFKGTTATIYRVKVQADYIEIQFNEGGGQTVERVFTQSEWPFDGKNYGGRINVRFERNITDDDLAIPNMAAMLSPLFCLLRDYDKNCAGILLPEQPAAAPQETP